MFAPVTVSVPVAAGELLVLAAGLVALLAANLLLLRPVFAPLDELAETMRRHDPLSPGARAEVSGDPDVVALAQTFNDMLDRLESERRESARQALLAQEAERRRIARELHDEVGQTLTGVMLQIEGLAGTIPEELRGQLEELRETARHGTEEVRRIARRLRPDALEELGLQSALAALAERVRAPDADPGGAAPGAGGRGHARRGARDLPCRAGGDDQHRTPRRARAGLVWSSATLQDAIVLTVGDDGRGLRPANRPSSHGIRGMRERAMLVGGDAQIDSRPEHGTAITLTIPR